MHGPLSVWRCFRRPPSSYRKKAETASWYSIIANKISMRWHGHGQQGGFTALRHSARPLNIRKITILTNHWYLSYWSFLQNWLYLFFLIGLERWATPPKYQNNNNCSVVIVIKLLLFSLQNWLYLFFLIFLERLVLGGNTPRPLLVRIINYLQAYHNINISSLFLQEVILSVISWSVKLTGFKLKHNNIFMYVHDLSIFCIVPGRADCQCMKNTIRWTYVH